MRGLFGREASSAIDPESAVSIGAAIQGSRLAGGEQDDTVLDIASHTLGIEGERGEFIPIIERNSMIPARKRQVFIIGANNPSRIQVHLLQGEADLAIQNESLGRPEFNAIPSAPAGEGHVELDFGIDEDGIASVESLAHLKHQFPGQEEDLDRTIADCDEAIRLNADDASAYQKRGSARFSKGDLDGAIGDYDEAIRLNPDDAATYEKRGYTRVEKGALDEGLVDLRQAIHFAEAARTTRTESEDDCEDLNLHADVAFFSGDYEGFLRWTVESLNRFPEAGRAEAGVASAYACKYAVSGVAADKAQTLFHLAKARKLAKESVPLNRECALCLREYEERTLYRLETREIISSGEYGRRFPTGRQTPRRSVHPSGGMSQAEVKRLVAETGTRETEERPKREPAGPSWDEIVESCREIASANGAMLIDPAGQVFAARGEWPAPPGPDAIATRLVAKMEAVLKNEPTRSICAPFLGLHLTAWRVQLSEGLMTVAFISRTPVRTDTRPAVDSEIHRGTGA